MVSSYTRNAVFKYVGAEKLITNYIIEKRQGTSEHPHACLGTHVRVAMFEECHDYGATYELVGFYACVAKTNQNVLKVAPIIFLLRCHDSL